jgi:tRNA dimethylallyltransferase
LPEVLALFGPNAVGKTATAVALADLMRDENPVAISADAMQVYAGLEMLTGAATPAEQERLEHRLIGFVPVTQEFSVGEYMPLAHEVIDAALAAGRRPLVVGGTGLYLRAALTTLDLKPKPDPAVRQRWLNALGEGGPQALHAELAAVAPWAAADVAPADGKRIVRLLELHEMGELEPAGPDSQLWTADTRHPTTLVGLTMDRHALYERIDARAEAIARAAAGEVRAADAAGASATARKAHGFEELLAGDVEAMKRKGRQYARRQLTWMRKLPDVDVIDVTGREPEDVAAEIAAKL